MFKKFINKIMGKKEEENQLQEESKEIQESQDEEAEKPEEPSSQEAQVEKEQEEAEVEAKEEIAQEEPSNIDQPSVEEMIEVVAPEETIEEEPVEERMQEDQEDEVVEEEVEEKASPFNFFKRLTQGLSKTKEGITKRVDQMLKMYVKIDEDLFEDLEEILITSDIGVNTTMLIVEKLRDVVKNKKLTEASQVRQELKEILYDILHEEEGHINVDAEQNIILVVGVNGVGKTTTIGKMAHRFKNQGKKVILAAGDTFRAAAIDQLEIWAERVGVDIIKHQENSDPGAVIFDAIAAAKSRKADILICDTAGRLHNKKNLMLELGKIFKIVEREYPNANREVLLVVDATTGQNAVQQAKVFKEACDINGIVLTKLDGTAKGGVILAVKAELDVPVKLIGVGEQMEDLQDFESKAFVDALFGDED